MFGFYIYRPYSELAIVQDIYFKVKMQVRIFCNSSENVRRRGFKLLLSKHNISTTLLISEKLILALYVLKYFTTLELLSSNNY